MSLVTSEHRGNAIWLWLDRPDRHNALIPELVCDLRKAIADAGRYEPVALVLSGRGLSFSTGGDIAGFLDHAGSGETLEAYAQKLVGALHEAILELLAFPAPVLAAVNGPVTGGSTGLVLTADLVAMAEDSFLQPYYSEVGFGPDGGWTALLPDRIGAAKALEIQYLNARLSAYDAAKLGLAAQVCPLSKLEATVEAWVERLSRGCAQTHLATRQNVWDERRLDGVRARLDQEKQRFMDLIARPATIAGMREFLRVHA
ncbi:enoyl-CoA hydratase/isomerase family protein [Rhodobacterales bacterium]|nr:enoyl-CoA hydratase/isomerase family protein [Rhodobacterales bacterium]